MSEDQKAPAMVIPPTEAAIVTASNMTELELVLPDLGDEDLPETGPPVRRRVGGDGLTGADVGDAHGGVRGCSPLLKGSRGEGRKIRPSLSP